MSATTAAERNARDLAKIKTVTALVYGLVDSVARLEPLEHPDSRWHPDDLRCCLFDTLHCLTAEAARAREPLLTPDEVLA